MPSSELPLLLHLFAVLAAPKQSIDPHRSQNTLVHKTCNLSPGLCWRLISHLSARSNWRRYNLECLA